MKLYIAASSKPQERARVDAAFAAVDGFYEIVGDWRADCDKFGANPAGLDCSPFAKADMNAVRECDVLWLLMPQSETRGAWVEFGLALAFGKVVVCSGEGQERSIFTSLAMRRYELDADAVTYLNGCVVDTFRAHLGGM
jgi:hypothetical protein